MSKTDKIKVNKAKELMEDRGDDSGLYESDIEMNKICGTKQEKQYNQND